MKWCNEMEMIFCWMIISNSLLGWTDCSLWLQTGKTHRDHQRWIRFNCFPMQFQKIHVQEKTTSNSAAWSFSIIGRILWTYAKSRTRLEFTYKINVSETSSSKWILCFSLCNGRCRIWRLDSKCQRKLLFTRSLYERSEWCKQWFLRFLVGWQLGINTNFLFGFFFKTLNQSFIFSRFIWLSSSLWLCPEAHSRL